MSERVGQGMPPVNSRRTKPVTGDVSGQGLFGVFNVLCDELVVRVVRSGDQLEEHRHVVRMGSPVRDRNTATDHTLDFGQNLGHVRFDASGESPVVVVARSSSGAAPFAFEIVNSCE